MKSLCNLSILSMVALLSLPPAVQAQNLVEKLQNIDEVSLFAEALQESALSGILSQNGHYTIFAPNNEAMRAEFGNGSVSDAYLRNHLMTGMATERNIRIMSRMTSMGGITLDITRSGETLSLNGAKILRANIQADNGVIHIIDRVLE